MHQIFSCPRHQKQRRTAQQEIKKTASPAAKDRHFNRVQLVTARSPVQLSPDQRLSPKHPRRFARN